MRLAAFPISLLAMALTACGGVDQDRPPERITVPRGATLTAVAESLSSRGVIGSKRFFKFYAKLTGRESEIQAGIFDLRHGTSVPGILDALVHGREATDPLALPEGLMLSEVAEQVQLQLGTDPDSFAAAVRDSALLSEVGAPAETLEGYLYPSTYYVLARATARDIVSQMVAEFQAQWRSEWDARLDELGMTKHEVVILASIIEGEVQDRSDSRLVSSVYHNRLRRGMRLQADPTVIYSLGHRRRLFERDYAVRSPYNTYRIDGLPPGPINQPSAASIEAALMPADTDYLYFVAGSNGRHVFTRTYQEHLAAIRRVRNPGAERSANQED
jgi:UPF0755 protein